MDFFFLFNCINDVIPYVILYLGIFWEFRRLPGKSIIPAALGVVAVTCISLTLFFRFFDMDQLAGMSLVMLAGPILCISGYFLVRVSVRLYAYIILIILQIAYLLEGLGMFFQTVFGGSLGLGLDTFANIKLPYYLSLLVIYGIALGLAFVLRKAISRPMRDFAHHRLWMSLCLPAGISAGTAFLFFYRTARSDAIGDPVTMGFYTLILLTFLFLHVISLRLTVQAMEGESAQRDLAAADQVLDMQKEQYRKLAQQITETRKTTHDLRHQLMALRAAAEKGDPELMASLWYQLHDRLPQETDEFYCDNYLVNSILLEYAARARKHQVAWDAGLETAAFPLPDLTLAALLGNALENALEATLLLPPQERRIYLRASHKGPYFTLVIKNTFDGNVQQEDGRYLSRKREFAKQGLGLNSIQHIVRQFGGEVRLSSEGKEFLLVVMLPVGAGEGEHIHG